MSDNAALADALIEPDDHEGDVRQAIEDLKIKAEPEARVVIDKSSAERARDSEGKFAEKPERKVLSIPSKDSGVQVPPTAIGEAVAPAFKIPDSWKPAAKEKFAAWLAAGNVLPPEVAADIERREVEITSGLGKIDDERKFGRTVSQIVSPYLPTIRAEGGTPERAIESLLQTAHVLRQGTDQQKANTVAAVVQQFKVPPQALISILQGANGGTGSPAQQGQFNPLIESLQQRLTRIEQERQQDLQQRQMQEQFGLQSQIEGFASDPKHEHFDKVRTFMGHLIESGQAKDMDEAYEKAIWTDPDIRSSLIAAQGDPSKRVNEQAALAERAKSAAVSVKGGPGGAKKLNGSANPNSSIEDDLRAAMREREGRV